MKSAPEIGPWERVIRGKDKDTKEESKSQDNGGIGQDRKSRIAFAKSIATDVGRA